MKELLKRLSLKKRLIAIFCLASVFTTLIVDDATGPIIIAEAYILPLCIGTWYLGEVFGFALAVIISTGWTVINYGPYKVFDTPAAYTARSVWMTFVFMLTTYMVVLLRASIEHKNGTVAMLEDKFLKLKEEQEDGHIGSLRAMVMMVDEKDSYTGEHSQRVQHVSIQIAKELGFSEVRLKHISTASLLHDIGKIGISEAILRKDSPLTHEEMVKVKNHPVKGARIVQSVPTLSSMSEAVLYHHVWYDGRGYPVQGLKRELIPIEARIIAVADAIDAMTHSRPYRGALSIEEILEQLREGSGTQFDPEIVKLFLAEKIELHTHPHVVEISGDGDYEV